MKSILISFFIVLIFPFPLLAQNKGTIAGKVIDEKTQEILAGLTISFNNGTTSKTTDVEGRYSFVVAPGTYTVKYEFVGYKPKTVTDIVVKEGSVTETNVVMEQASKELTTVVVTASARRESVASVLSLQKNNASISDGISIETIRKSPDRNVGEVLKRVSGTSIQDDKFVVIRGLSDRYNVALINGAVLPSTEPDRRAFSFDIVPSNLIDNILINKTASPDLPGDFSGGIVQVLTKDIPFRNFMGVSVGIGYNAISTGKNFRIGLLEPTDYLGFDNGTRILPGNFPGRRKFASYESDPSPERKIEASKILRNNYGDRYNGSALPSLSFQINWGGKKDFTNGATIGSVLALTYRNAQNIQYNKRRDYQTVYGLELTPANVAFDYDDTTYSFNTNMGVLANFAYKKGNNKIVFKNLLNRIFENSNLNRTGFNNDNGQFVQATGSIAVAKSLISSQLEGEHRISSRNDRIKWNTNYTLTVRNQPDYRVLPYAKSIGQVDDKSVPFEVVLRDTYRFWSDLYDNAFGGTLNYSLPFEMLKEKSIFKAGLMGQYKIRDFSTRIFRYDVASPRFNRSLLSLPSKQIFNDGNMFKEGFALDEITNNSDKYDAISGLYAGYVMVDGRLTKNLRAVYGVRIEAFNFQVNTGDFSNPKVKVKRDYVDVLPSVNLTYSLSNKTNMRLSASRTVSRPELREVANFAYYDFVRNAQLKGNIDLVRSQNTNLDLRFETYPSAGEIISASLFYKHFDKPIEQRVLPGSVASNLVLDFTNQNSSQNYGAELEVRKNLDFFGGGQWLENLLFYANAAIIQSKVDFAQGNIPFDNNRPLQGQSPYLLNAGLQYSTLQNKLSFSALFNRVGHRISAVGFDGYADIYENARSIVDFQMALKTFKDKGEFKINFSDLLNQRSIFYQNVDVNDNTSYNSTKDRIQYSFLYGSNFSLAFTYNIR